MLLEEEDPFIARLLGTFLQGDKAAETLLHRFSQDTSTIESILRKRMSATMASASTLLQDVEALHSGGGKAGSTTSEEPKSKEVKLAALSNLLRAENSRLKDQALQDAAKIKELSNALADREDELLVAQRKIAQLRQNPDAHPPIHSAPSHVVVPVKENHSNEEQVKKPAAPSGDDDSKVHSAKELQELQAQLERRTAEVEARDAALGAAERYVPLTLLFCLHKKKMQ